MVSPKPNTNRCAYFKGRFRSPNLNFGVPGNLLAPLGSILVTWGGPRDMKGSPMRKRADSGNFSPLFGTKIIKNNFQIVFSCDLWPLPIFDENCRETSEPGPLECDENIVNTVSDAMSPWRNKIPKMMAQGSNLEGFGVTSGSLWAPNGTPEAVF